MHFREHPGKLLQTLIRIAAMKNYIVRGIMIGGSMGVIGALLGYSDSLPRAFGVGMLAGALAGLTLGLRQRKKK